jgi:basic membrane lipoprotein Med (substrate-binding protein (PBP1-ABC) superfamily)
MGRLAHELVCVPHEIEKSLTHLKEAEEAEKKFKKLFSEVEKLSDSGWNEDNYSAELGDAMKKIENIRLEVIKSSTRLDKIKNNMPVKNAGGEPQFGIHEIASLSFRQTLKLGMNFFLPVIIALIVCSFILSCAIIISMAGF